jgi:cardiolipin synthase
MINVPIALTLLRLCLIPVIIFTLFLQHWQLAFRLLLIAVATDFLDGFLARKLNQATKIGALLDHLSDKILIISLFITFLLVSVPTWLLVLVLVKETVMLALVGILVRRKHIVMITPLAIGKVAMAMQMLFALWVIASQVWSLPLHAWVIWAVTLFVVLSILFYGMVGWQLLQRKS